MAARQHYVSISRSGPLSFINVFSVYRGVLALLHPVFGTRLPRESPASVIKSIINPRQNMSRAMHWAIWWLAGEVFYLGETASLLNRSARFNQYGNKSEKFLDFVQKQ